MISLLVVNYRSAALAAEAVRTARAATSQPLQVVIVDNSEDHEEQTRLSTFADVVIASETNRGYAGGINLGRPACTGEAIVITNPDVTFAPGCIDHLAAELRGGVAAAGPALFWDDGHQWMLPPGDRHTTAEKLDQVLSTRSPSWHRQRDRRRFLERVAFWSLTETADVPMLSGAIIAVRTADFDAVGGFDERFPLYFEETDFLRRIAAVRKRIVYVPAAKARHMYNQSAGQVQSEAAARYAHSEIRYLEKWSGPFMARLLKRGERTLLSASEQTGVSALQVAALREDDVVTEASPSPAFETAAGHFGAAEIPAEVRHTLKTDFYVRTVARQTGRILGTYKISP
jgi:GT2 family glycosyltransferase